MIDSSRYFDITTPSQNTDLLHRLRIAKCSYSTLDVQSNSYQHLPVTPREGKLVWNKKSLLTDDLPWRVTTDSCVLVGMQIQKKEILYTRYEGTLGAAKDSRERFRVL